MTHPPTARTLEGETAPKFAKSVAAPRLRLTVEREAGAPASRSVTIDGDRVRVGSHESNDVVLVDPMVSRFHFQLLRERVAWRLLDTGSRNGTTIHGVRVRDGELTAPEAVLELGESRVRVTELPSETEIEILDQATFGDLYGRSTAMQRLFAILTRVAAHDTNVLIEGESGTGKELVAGEIVRRGARARKPFVVVDCSAISPNLIESELFGHLRGAFTGADRERAGAFETANGGTVFLDEIGELPLDMQPKLLRALEAREIRRLGETTTRKIDVRVIAATNRQLEREVNEGRFREDLYFRLSVVTVRVPALRERPEDVALLVRAFIDALEAHASAHLFTPEVMADLARQPWPGNVRELRNYVERAVVLQDVDGAPPPRANRETRGSGVRVWDLSTSFRDAKEEAMAEFECAYLTALMEWAGGNVSRAARKAKMDRMNLHRLVQRYNLKAPRGLRD
ncbi:MAG TPA: sigma 54-interacting transcriptional regulator [Polyangiaceae bacterium]|jgi:DNA-binding NtrC family response regulator|nr:sigma 54-interacting transcriptional regulator [Polyangiaceae bacterium]